MSLLISTDGRIRHLRIDRPSRRNALDRATALALTVALHQAAADPGIGAVVLAGTGPCFCAGSDLKELAGKSPAEMAAMETTKATLARTIAALELPVVAAVHGYALGGGAALAAACDAVVSDTDAGWHMPEVVNGWIPPWGLHPLLARCGSLRARQLLWAPTRIDGAAAAQLGLVDQCCPTGQALAVASRQAVAWAALPPAASRSIKPYLRDIAERSAAEADALASSLFTAHCATPEALTTFSRFGAKP